jgi:hypothetical protein
MATFGSGINAQLGAIDYSPILRGAQAQAQGILAGGQGIARGIESMGGSLAKGVEKHYEQQDQMKVMLGELDMIRKASPEAFKNVDPKVAERIAKGDIKYKEVAPLYASVMTQQKLNQISQQKKQQDFLNSIQGRQVAAEEARTNAALTSAAADFNRSQPKPMQEMTFEQLDILKKAGQDVQWVPNVGGKPGTVLVTGGSPFAPQAPKAPDGYRFTPDGNLEPIPGGPRDVKAVGSDAWNTVTQRESAAAKDTEASLENVAKKEEQAQKYLKRAESTRRDLLNTRKTLDEAIDLVSRGAGGQVAGLAPVRNTTAALGGIAEALGVPGAKDASGAKTLNSKYNSLRASFKLDKMAELKELSPTGATGFGNQSDAEGRSLESSFVELDASLPENVQLQNLIRSKQRIDSLLGGLDSDLQLVSPQSKSVGRFKIIKVGNP